MKILIFTNSIWNIENFRIDLINAFLKEGHDIVILTSYQNKKQIKNVKKKLIKKVTIQNVNIIAHGTFFFQEFLLLKNIVKKIKKIKPDCAFSFTIKPNIYLGISKIFYKDFLFYPTITGLGYSYLDSSNLIKSIYFLLYKISIKNANKVIFQNKYDLSLFQKKINKSNKKFLLIRGSGFKNLKKYNFSFNKKIKKIIFIGRILKQKGIMEYLNAARNILKNKSNICFYIIGDLATKNRDSIGVNKLNKYTNDKIIYLGNILDKQKILNIINNSDCVILSSHREGLSRSTIEAMSCGRPIIVSSAPGCIDLVDKKNINGYVYNVRCFISLSKAIKRFLGLKLSEMIKMSKNSRKLFLQKYESSVIVKEYLKLIYL